MQGVSTAMAGGTMAIVFAAAVLRPDRLRLRARSRAHARRHHAARAGRSRLHVHRGGRRRLRSAPRDDHVPLALPVALAASAVTPAGAFLSKHISPEAARVAIALFTIAAVFGVARAGAAGAPFGPVRALAYGVVAGLFNGLASMPGPPVVAYFMSSSLSREAIRASMLIVFQITVCVGPVERNRLWARYARHVAARGNFPAGLLDRQLGRGAPVRARLRADLPPPRRSPA